MENVESLKTDLEEGWKDHCDWGLVWPSLRVAMDGTVGRQAVRIL